MQSNHPDTKAKAGRLSPAIAMRWGLAALVTVVGSVVGASGCLERPLCDKDCRPRTTNIFVDTISQKSVDKIDLLFMIDNSISMADKQKVMAAAVPDLVGRLVNPDCVDPDTGARLTPAADPDADCAQGVREFTPIRNIHIGVITSSLGGHGSDKTCKVAKEPIKMEEVNDYAHLIATRPRFQVPAGGEQPDGFGFLDWHPPVKTGQQLQPFNTTFQAMTQAAGEFGCGYEASLEAIYRFLSDPAPPQEVITGPCPPPNQAGQCAQGQGLDQQLLDQRHAFLRTDSLVAIVLLSDENDCSIRDGQQYYYATKADIILWGSNECGPNPNAKCCYSCATGTPAGCAPCGPQPPPDTDPPNLRCYKQKQRFGLDFLYPTARYVNALKLPQLCTSRADLDSRDPSQCPDLTGDGQPDIFPNDLFQDPNHQSVPRETTLVFFAGIVGVPWQTLQSISNKDGVPYPATELHYLKAAELQPNGVWEKVLGNANPDPATNAPPILPTDPHMQENIDPRPGLPGPSSGYLQDPINGHEWTNSKRDDLQYACIFEQNPADVRDCATEAPATDTMPARGCDCSASAVTDLNPLCQGPAGGYGTQQFFAKAYPGLRELQVLKDFGNNSIVASICAKNLTDQNRQDYGYRPAVDAIVERLKEALTGKCLPRELKADANGNVPCSVIEARPGGAGCDGTQGRKTPDSRVTGPARLRLQQAGYCGGSTGLACSAYSLCEIAPAGPDCHQDVKYNGIPGYCYVDPKVNPNDDPNLVKNCPATERRLLRFVDPNSQTPANDAKVLIACFGAELDEGLGSAPVAGGAGGAPAAGSGGAPPVVADGAAPAPGG